MLDANMVDNFQKDFDENRNGNLKLICNECGNKESKPYDIGDKCVCGGKFQREEIKEKY